MRAGLALTLPLLALAVQAWASWRSSRNYRAIPELPAAPEPAQWPRVSIIVPARNEAATLPLLLDSLARSDYPEREVIVVDDASEDGTGAIARGYEVRVVAGSGPPAGWLGKPYACHLGQAAARGEWLLFVDADTWHAPDCLRRVMAYALAEQRPAVSLMLRQECGSFWERALLPYAYQQLFVGSDPRRINQSGGREAVANGQFLLVRRDRYQAAGGHEAIRDSVIDDVALAHRLQAVGYPVALRRGEALAGVRMYRGLADIWRGFSKNSARFLLANPRSGLPVVVSSVAVGAWLPLTLRALRARSAAGLGLSVLSYAVLAVGLADWTSRFGAGRAIALAQPLSAAVFQAVSLNALLRTLLRRSTSWKGRPV